MSQPFSLNDQDIIKMVEEARATQDPNLLRGHIYKLAMLRAEMANRLSLEMRSRADIERVAKSLSELMGREHSRAVSMIFDRNGTLSSLRKELASQIETNRSFAAELETLRALASPSNIARYRQEIQRLNSALSDAHISIQELNTRSQAYEEQLSDLPRIQEMLRAERDKVQELEGLLAEAQNRQPAATQAEPQAITIDNSEEIATLREQLATAQQRISDLERVRYNAPALAQTGDELESVRTLFNQQFAGVIAEKMRLERVETDNLSKIAEQARIIDGLTAELGQAKSSATAARESLQSTQAELQSERGVAQGLNLRVRTLDEQIEQLQETLSLKEKQLDTARKELGDASEQNRDQSQRVLTLEDEVADLKVKHQSLQGELASTREALARGESVVSEKEGRIRELVNSLEQIKLRESQLNSDLAKTRIDFDSQSRQLESNHRQLQAISDERDSLNQALAHSNIRIAELSAEMDRLKHANSDLTRTIEDTQQELDRLIQETERDAQANRARIAEGQAAIHALQGDLSTANHQIKRLEQRAETLKEGLITASKARSAYRTEAAEMALELRSANNEAGQLREQLQQAERLIVSLRDQLATSKKVIHLESPSLSTQAFANIKPEDSRDTIQEAGF